MNCAVCTESEETIAALVHDLRQPLGTLEYSALYLQILLGEAEERVRQQLCLMQQQIELAAQMVSRAAERTARPAIQRAAAGESLDFTKSETAAVT
jgi:signal transduction histidine kinase